MHNIYYFSTTVSGNKVSTTTDRLSLAGLELFNNCRDVSAVVELVVAI